jgi:hypothetical protein
MVPPRLFAARDFAVVNLTTFLMSGAIFAAGLLVTEEFQLGRGYSPVGAGARVCCRDRNDELVPCSCTTGVSLSSSGYAVAASSASPSRRYRVASTDRQNASAL